MHIIREVEQGCRLELEHKGERFMVWYEYEDDSKLSAPEFQDCGSSGTCYTVPFGDGWSFSVEVLPTQNPMTLGLLVDVVRAFVTGKFR